MLWFWHLSLLSGLICTSVFKDNDQQNRLQRLAYGAQKMCRYIQRKAAGNKGQASFYSSDRLSPSKLICCVAMKGGTKYVPTEEAQSNILTAAVSHYGKQPLLLPLR